MNHYHLIYTPKGLADLNEDSMIYATSYAASQEMGQGGVHWHVYLQTDYGFDKISDTLKDVQKIPSGSRGKKSLHYSNRHVDAIHKDFPETDFQKFTLGYTLKNQTINPSSLTYVKGYTPEFLQEAYDYYQEIVAKREKPTKLPGEALVAEPREKKDNIQEVWVDYQVCLLKGINQLSVGVTPSYFKKKAWGFWKKRNNGVFPPASYQYRLLQSIWAQYLDIVNQELDLELVTNELKY